MYILHHILDVHNIYYYYFESKEQLDVFIENATPEERLTFRIKKIYPGICYNLNTFY
jgi:hypothetical protein